MRQGKTTKLKHYVRQRRGMAADKSTLLVFTFLHYGPARKNRNIFYASLYFPVWTNLFAYPFLHSAFRLQAITAPFVYNQTGPARSKAFSCASTRFCVTRSAMPIFQYYCRICVTTAYAHRTASHRARSLSALLSLAYCQGHTASHRRARRSHTPMSHR